MPASPSTGAIIRRARKLLGLTQQQLAEKVGVSRNTVTAWETNRSYPERYDVALEQALNITLDGSGQEPEPELVATDQWEAAVLADPDLPEEWKVTLVRESRAARAEYVRLKRERRAAQARQEAARSDPGTRAG